MNYIPNLTDSELRLILLQLIASFILLGVVLLISQLNNLNLQKRIITAGLRGFFQLLVLSLILVYVFSISIIIVEFLILGSMILFGAQTASKRLSGLNNVFKVEFASMIIAVYLIMTIITIIGAIPIDDPKIWIPIGGMATGNSMNISYLTISRIKNNLENQSDEIETALSLGFIPRDVLRELNIISSSMRLGITPNMNNLRTLGLVFIPGLMTGLLIGGVNPVIAAIYQIMIFFVIISSGLLAAYIGSTLIIRELFDKETQNLVI